jgi:hypothetical protein
MKIKYCLKIVILFIIFVTISCATNQQSLETRDKADITNKEAFDTPSRQHIPPY